MSLKITDNKPIIFLATVKDTKDPKKLGRVQVELSAFAKAVEMPWLRLIQPMAGKKHGVIMLPEKDDVVAVIRGAGDRPNSMYILGSVYDGKNKPEAGDPDAHDGKNNVKQLKTRSGHLFVISDEKGKEKVSIKTGTKKLLFEMDDSKEKLTIKIKSLSLEMDGAGKSITLDSNDKIVIKGAKTVSIEGTGTKVEIKGKDAMIKANMNCKVEALNVEVKASAQCKVSGSAMVQIKGGMVQIN